MFGLVKRSLAAAVVLGGFSIARSEPAATALSSPMVDTSMYRAGEVRRLSGAYGDWRVVCDEIAKLKQRFCSLKTDIVGADGSIVARIDMSTGDNGQPVALLHLPLGLVVRSGVDIGLLEAPVQRVAARSVAKGESGRHLSVATCDGQECLALWSLKASDIVLLRQARALGVQFTVRQGGSGDPFALNQPILQTLVNGRLSPVGFTAAVDASLH